MGDPVDVVTGLAWDETRDVFIDGVIPIEWWRHWTSAPQKAPGPLGWGQTHEYDHELRFDLEGIRYRGSSGASAHFALLARDGEVSHADGHTLARTDARTYRVHCHGRRSLEFQFADYESPARLIAVHAGEHALQLRYDGQGRLRALLDPAGRMVRLDWDAQRRIERVTLSARGAQDRVVAAYTYDARGDLVRFVDAYGHACTFEYDSAHRWIRRTDRTGYGFVYEYDRAGRCTYTAGEDGLVASRHRYLPEARMTLVTTASGGEWQYFFNEAGTVTEIIDPYGGKQVFELDEDGRVETEIDAVGRKTRFLYDASGAAIAKITPLGDYVALPEDPNAPDPRAHRLPSCAREWEYGDLLAGQSTLPEVRSPWMQQLPSAAKAAVAAATEAVSPLSDDYVPGTEARPATKREVRDDFGLLLREERVDGSKKQWQYTPNGLVRKVIDGCGGITEYEYAGWNQRVAQRDPLGHVTRIEWTKSYQIAAVTDPGGTRSEYRYDKKDRLVEVWRHGVMRERYGYDLGDRLTHKWDARGELMFEQVYGPNGEMSERRFADGSRETREYDENGRLRAAHNAAGAQRFEFDRRGRRVADLRDGRGVRHVLRGGRIRETRVLEHFVTRYDYEDDGTVVVTDPTGATHKIRRPGHGVLLKEFVNGSSEVVQYGPEGHCLTKATYRVSADGVSTWQRAYLRDEEGRLSEVRDSAHGTQWYEHDPAGRLIATRDVHGRGEHAAHDVAGNVVPPTSGGARSAWWLEGNRLGGANGERFEYDHRNHLAARVGERDAVRYRYDGLDQLVAIEGLEREWEADYDVLGRRVQRRWGKEKTFFWWDGDRLAALQLLDGSLRIYVYGDECSWVPLLWIDYQSIGSAENGRRIYPFGNALGAPVVAIDDTGQSVWDILSSQTQDRTSAGRARYFQPVLEPGHFLDIESGVVLNRYRNYEPRLGRYLESDPMGLVGGLNLYNGVASPVTNVDLLGLTGAWDPCKGRLTISQDDGNRPDGEMPGIPGEESKQPSGSGGAGPTAEHLARLAELRQRSELRLRLRALERQQAEGNRLHAERLARNQALLAAHDRAPGSAGDPLASLSAADIAEIRDIRQLSRATDGDKGLSHNSIDEARVMRQMEATNHSPGRFGRPVERSSMPGADIRTEADTPGERNWSLKAIPSTDTANARSRVLHEYDRLAGQQSSDRMGLLVDLRNNPDPAAEIQRINNEISARTPSGTDPVVMVEFVLPMSP